ncbi:MAG: TonB-dependent receptor [Bryobacteraceae bacterium]
MTTTLFLFLMFQVRGIVSDPSGRPVEGAQAVCGSETKSTDARGIVEFDAPCKATVTKPGFADQTADISASGDTQIALRLATASERVVVTATGAPLAIEDAGVAADVFTTKDFAPARGPFAADLLRDVAGLAVVQTGQNGGLTSLFSRGGDANTALVLLDGVPITEPGGSLDLVHLTSAGLDRMEVIRSPESALFGAEASSAVIQIFTRHGDTEATRPHGSLTYERGSFSTDHWTGALDGGLAQRIDYAFTSDQFRSTGEFPNDAYRITSGTANVGFKLSDKTSLRAVYRTFDSYTGAPGQTFYGLTNLDANETARDSAVSVRLDDTRGSRFTQRALFGYHRYRDIFSDNVSESYDVAALVRTVPGPNPRVYLVRQVPPSTTVADPGTTLVDSPQFLFAFPGLTITDRTSASYQGTLAHRGGELVFGYEYERQAGLISATNVARNNNGMYAHEQYALTRRIFLTGGARLEHSSTFGEKFAAQGAATFRLPTETYLRITAARGIKEPALIENFANETFYVGNPSLRPEKTDTLEVGLSREWFDRRLRTEVSYFRNLFTDLIEFDSSVFPGTWQNVNRSWARGMEASASFRLARAVTIRGEYTKLGTRITVSDTPGELGTELLRRPRNSGSVSLELTPRRWTLIAGARFVGERQDNDFVFGVNRNPGYQYVYAGASWQAAKHVAPYVRVNNALDSQYQEALGYSALSRSVLGGVRLTW